ncbi:MAG: flagellar brake protein [Spongiibacteraceae bacterium]
MLKSLFARLRGAQKKTKSEADNYSQLEILQKRHSFIEVKFPRVEQSFQSMILELHADDGFLVIDELYPAEGRQQLLEGDEAEIIAQVPGIKVAFYSKLLMREVAEGLPVYRMELPEEIGSTVRRRAFRVYVERETNLTVDLGKVGDSTFDAHIVNLSPDGIKLSLRGNVAKQLEKNRMLEKCLIRLPNGIDIDADIELRNIYAIRTPTHHTLAGGILTVAIPSQRTKLNQYLAAVQRKQRRRESRMA